LFHNVYFVMDLDLERIRNLEYIHP
jgi:hypothetical protein